MKKLIKQTIASVALAGVLVVPASAELYRVTSIAPGMSPFVVNTAIAKLVSKHVPDTELQVRATGAATKHFVEAAKGKVDFLFSSPTLNWLAVNNIGPYKKIKDAPELEKQIGMIFSYQMGPYHYITRADSGIEKLEDIKGKKVFAGPPGGAATTVVTRNIKQATGLEAQTDYEVQKFGFDAAIQAFQDDKIDVIVLPTNIPSPPVEQFALTKKIRFINIPMDKVKVPAATGGTKNEVPADAYGDNQVNTEVSHTHGALVNFSAGMHVDEEVVYQITKAIWDNIGELHKTAKWMENVITLDNALQIIPGRLHPGAARYYKEKGIEIPEAMVYKPKS